MTPQTLDMFAGVVNDIANGPRVGSFQGLTADLLRRLSEKGLTLEQCADRRMLARSRSTLESRCREFGIRFPDYTPSNMRKHVTFEPNGDFLNLIGPEAKAVAAALGIAILKAGANDMCTIPAHGFDAARETLKSAGYVAKKVKPAKARKEVANG